MKIEELRRAAAERIRESHRRAGDQAPAVRVTVTESGPHFDCVRVEYEDGEVREFQRCRASE
jgi:hypothetical protein